MVGSYHLTLWRVTYGTCTVVQIYFWSHLRSLLVPIDKRIAINQSHEQKCSGRKEVSMGLPRCETVLDPEPCWFRKSRSPKASVAGLEKVRTQVLVWIWPDKKHQDYNLQAGLRIRITLMHFNAPHSADANLWPLIYRPFRAVLGIRIRMFLGLQDPDPLVRGADPAPDPSLFWNNFFFLNNDCKKYLTQNTR